MLQCPVALVDTDTCFADHPAKLFERIGPGASVMHAFEYRIGETELWSPLLARLGGAGVVAEHPIDRAAPMYNSA